MRLTLTPTTAHLTGPIALEEWSRLALALSYIPPGEGYRQYRLRRWRPEAEAQRVQLWTWADGTVAFPAGLTSRVLEALRRPVDVEAPPPLPWARVNVRLPDGTGLRDDQMHFATLALQAQTGLLALATGYGKTLILAAILAATAPAPALVLVKSRKLGNDLYERLSGYLREHLGWIGERPFGVRPMGRVTVGTIGTVRSRLHTPEVQALCQTAQVLLVDEVHRVSPTLWFPVLGRVAARVRLGVSGTVREVRERRPLEAYLGPLLGEYGERDMAQHGLAPQVTVLMARVGHLVDDATSYEAQYDQAIVRGDHRNRMLGETVARLAGQGLPCLVLVYRREHGQRLQTALESLGVQSVWVWGGSSTQAAQAAQDGLLAGRLGAVVASVVWNEGVDLPGLRVLVNAAGWKSRVATAQKSGRAVRLPPGGDPRTLILDVWDLGSATLRRHAEARRATYQRRGFRVVETPGGYEPALSRWMAARTSDGAMTLAMTSADGCSAPK